MLSLEYCPFLNGLLCSLFAIPNPHKTSTQSLYYYNGYMERLTYMGKLYSIVRPSFIKSSSNMCSVSLFFVSTFYLHNVIFLSFLAYTFNSHHLNKWMDWFTGKQQIDEIWIVWMRKKSSIPSVHKSLQIAWIHQILMESFTMHHQHVIWLQIYVKRIENAGNVP